MWSISKMSEPRTYYVDLKDGYDTGDVYHFKGREYEVIDIDACNQLMTVEEIKSEKN
jgi:hypothetical protein